MDDRGAARCSVSRLIVFASLQQILALHALLALRRLEEHPALHAVRHGVPGGGAQGVGVHRGARAFGADAEPAEGRPGVGVHQGEPVVGEEAGHLKGRGYERLWSSS